MNRMRSGVIALSVICIVIAVGSVIDRASQDRYAKSGSSGRSSDLIVLASDNHRFTCTQCQIRIVDPLEFGNGVNAPSIWSRVLRDHIGNYWVSSTFSRGTIALYDSSGTLTRVVGRPGPGPQELKLVGAMATVKDGVVAADFGNGRLNRYGFAGNLISSHPMKFAPRYLQEMNDGRFVAVFPQPFGPTPSSVHILSDTGSYLSGIVPLAHYSDDARGFLEGGRLAAVCPNGDVLVMDLLSYTMRELRNGRVTATLASSVNWFEGHTSAKPSYIGEGYGNVQALSVDQANRAWVVISVSDPAWQGSSEQENPKSGDPLTIADMHQRYNTAVEVWDLNSGRLLSGVMLDQWIVGFADAEHMYTYYETESGEQRARVWKLYLEM